MGGDVWRLILSHNGNVTIDCRELSLSSRRTSHCRLGYAYPVCQQFGCTMSVTALLKIRMINNIFKQVYGIHPLHRVNTEMVCYQPAAELNSLFFFFFFCRRRTPDASSGIRETTYQFVVALQGMGCICRTEHKIC